MVFVGWDTETIAGKVILIANSERRFIFNSEFVEPENIMDLLWIKGKKRYNYLYNVKYDFLAMLKTHITQVDDIRNFQKFKEVEIGDYKLFWIPGKFFSIQKGNNFRNRIYFYEIANIFKGGLDKNAKKYLGEGKTNFLKHYKNTKELKEDLLIQEQLGFVPAHGGIKKHEHKITVTYAFDTAHITYDKLDSETYVKNLIEYCIIDCKRTKELADYFYNLISPILETKKFFSPAYIGEKYMTKFLNNNKLWKHYRLPPEFHKFPLFSYYGGRFELLKKGIFDKVYNYDINSAYPQAMTEFCQFIGKPTYYDGEFSIEDIYHFYGIYDVEIYPFKNNINPLAIRFIKQSTNMINYPCVGKKIPALLTYWDVRLLSELGIRFKINVIIKINHNGKSMFPFIPDLYARRKKLKEQKNDQQMVLKILMNSMYGKTLQIVTRNKMINEEYIEKFKVPDEKIKSFLCYGTKNYYIEELALGSLFNPWIGTYITSKVRYDLYKASHDNNTIMYATDGIYSTKELKLDIGKELGQWDEGIYEDMIFVKSGIYWNKNIIHYRGYTFNKDKEDMIEDMKELEKKEKKLRKIQLEAMIINGGQMETKLIPFMHYNKHGLEKIHTFQEQWHKMDIFTDHKRIYPEFNKEDIFNKSINSKPFTTEDEPVPYKIDLYQKGLIEF
jgi:hypothetical protein